MDPVLALQLELGLDDQRDPVTPVLTRVFSVSGECPAVRGGVSARLHSREAAHPTHAERRNESERGAHGHPPSLPVAKSFTVNPLPTFIDEKLMTVDFPDWWFFMVHDCERQKRSPSFL